MQARQTVLEKQAVKAAVRQRDGYRCQDCGMTQGEHQERYGKALPVHRLQKEARYATDSCIALCGRCHRLRHAQGSVNTSAAPEEWPWAERLRRQRERRRLTNSKLASLLEVPVRTIISWLYHERSPSPSGRKLIELLEADAI